MLKGPGWQVSTMPRYIRRRVPGGTYFFTVNLADPGACTLCLEIDVLRECYASVSKEQPFRTDSIVVLPNHLHAIWTLPAGDSDFSNRWRRIKAGFTRRFRQKAPGFLTRSEGPEPSVWQPRFWEHVIRDRDDLEKHRAYCWSDPVRHGLVHDPMDWRFSSFSKRDVRFSGVGELDFPEMAFPTGERDDTLRKGGRIPRPTKEDAA